MMLFESVAKVIAEHIDREVSEIAMDSSFEDLGIDSLDTMDILIKLEEEVGKEIDLQEPVKTVADLISVIEKQLQE